MADQGPFSHGMLQTITSQSVFRGYISTDGKREIGLSEISHVLSSNVVEGVFFIRDSTSLYMHRLHALIRPIR